MRPLGGHGPGPLGNRLDGRGGLRGYLEGYAAGAGDAVRGMLAAPKHSGSGAVLSVKVLRGSGAAPQSWKKRRERWWTDGASMAFRRTPLYDEAVLMLHMPSIEGRLPRSGFVQRRPNVCRPALGLAYFGCCTLFSGPILFCPRHSLSFYTKCLKYTTIP